jgi:hypothetical protein
LGAEGTVLGVNDSLLNFRKYLQFLLILGDTLAFSELPLIFMPFSK